jgi:lipoprotein-anchoring transpeptidase ErfK/SrfK
MIVNKNILKISVVTALVLIIAVIIKFSTDLLSSKKLKPSIGAAVSVFSDESAQLKNAGALLTDGNRAEAIRALEKISSISKGGRDGYKSLIMLADIYYKDENLTRAKELYLTVINEYSQFCNYADMQEKITSIRMAILFSKIITPDSELYIVMPGDSLMKIANKYSTTVDLIKRANGLRSDLIIPGTKLKVQKVPFYIIIDKSQSLLTLLLGDEVIKSYIVSTGKNNSTPTGTFKIKDKLVKPVWYNRGVTVPADDPENVLGSRWMGISTEEGGYGIHGTIEPESIGYQCTDGCVRMRNKEVEELYAIVPVGTGVTIVD